MVAVPAHTRAVMKGEEPAIEMTPAAREAIQDFNSPDAQSLEGIARHASTHAAGVVVAGRLVLFAKEPSALTDVTVTLPTAGSLQGLVVDLVPDTTYYYRAIALNATGESSPSAVVSGKTVKISRPFFMLTLLRP